MHCLSEMEEYNHLKPIAGMVKLSRAVTHFAEFNHTPDW